jgi:hypothetical protein
MCQTFYSFFLTLNSPHKNPQTVIDINDLGVSALLEKKGETHTKDKCKYLAMR